MGQCPVYVDSGRPRRKDGPKSALTNVAGSAALERRLHRSMTDDDAGPAGLASTFRRSYVCRSRECRHLTPAEPKHPERDQRQPK
jgi:hypothetical protein